MNLIPENCMHIANFIPRVPESCTMKIKVSLSWKKSDEETKIILFMFPQWYLECSYHHFKMCVCVRLFATPQTVAHQALLQARTLEWVETSFSKRNYRKKKVKSLSRVQLFATPWTAAYQAPPSMEFSRQKYWRRLPFSSPPFKITSTY